MANRIIDLLSFSKIYSVCAFFIGFSMRYFDNRCNLSVEKKPPVAYCGLVMVSDGPGAGKRSGSGGPLAGNGQPVHVHPDDRSVSDAGMGI